MVKKLKKCWIRKVDYSRVARKKKNSNKMKYNLFKKFKNRNNQWYKLNFKYKKRSNEFRKI